MKEMNGMMDEKKVKKEKEKERQKARKRALFVDGKQVTTLRQR